MIIPCLRLPSISTKELQTQWDQGRNLEELCTPMESLKYLIQRGPNFYHIMKWWEACTLDAPNLI